jgi:hypothetical protein
MAAEFKVNLLAELTGLGKHIKYPKTGTDETTPTAGSYMYRTIAGADAAEALDLGDVSTVTAIVLYAVDYDVLIDCDYDDAAFDADLTAKAAGIPAVITYPSGTVYVQGETGKTPKYEYLVIGTA